MNGYVNKLLLTLMLGLGVALGSGAASAAIVTITNSEMARADATCVSPATKECGLQVVREGYEAQRNFNSSVYKTRRQEASAWYRAAKAAVTDKSALRQLRDLYDSQLLSAQTDWRQSVDLAKQIYRDNKAAINAAYSQ